MPALVDLIPFRHPSVGAQRAVRSVAQETGLTPQPTSNFSVDRSLVVSLHLIHPSSPIPVDTVTMVRVSTTIVLAALDGAPSFAAPVALETRDSQEIETRPHRRQSSGVSGSILGRRAPVGSMVSQRSLQAGIRDLVDQFDMEVRNGGKQKKDNINKQDKVKPPFRTLDTISNNIANVNTVGYKSSKVTFQDVYAKTLRPRSAVGFSSLGSVIRSSAPSYTGARRSFIEDGFALETRRRHREGSPDLFEAREIDELD
ncbi:hypothetical protein BKA70DRAFT_1430457 [Coprinopsis sp. MPI-PUGE-AT-0042]|nr:hypothetical protein BKA70DRAFT_1430457 [Coprinopsis sp. MPI-PUGE-AT-0042]